MLKLLLALLALLREPTVAEIVGHVKSTVLRRMLHAFGPIILLLDCELNVLLRRRISFHWRLHAFHRLHTRHYLGQTCVKLCSNLVNFLICMRAGLVVRKHRSHLLALFLIASVLF
jgi:hypothetical protein